MVVVWCSSSALVSINEVNQHRVRLVLGWATISRFNSRCWTFISLCNQPPRPAQPSILPRSVNEDQLWLERKRQVWFIPLADECRVCRQKRCEIPWEHVPYPSQLYDWPDDQFLVIFTFPLFVFFACLSFSLFCMSTWQVKLIIIRTFRTTRLDIHTQQSFSDNLFVLVYHNTKHRSHCYSSHCYFQLTGFSPSVE